MIEFNFILHFLDIVFLQGDILGVFGSGIGVLLTVDILINYYNQLVREKVEVVMPRLGAWLGR